jgi:hypothetical protein
MKTTITIFTIFILLSCDNKSKSDNSRETVTIDNKEKTTNELIGDWGILVTGYGDDTEEYCNECPRVLFKVNGTGTITFPTGTTEQIEWKRENDRLKIKNISTDSDHGKFSDGEYSMTFKKEVEFIELELKETKTSYHYILRR